MSLTPKRKNRPGSLLFLRSYPQKVSARDPATDRVPFQKYPEELRASPQGLTVDPLQPNANIFENAEVGVSDRPWTLGELVFGRVDDAVRPNDREKEMDPT